jgi:hypothetical protein
LRSDCRWYQGRRVKRKERERGGWQPLQAAAPLLIQREPIISKAPSVQEQVGEDWDGVSSCVRLLCTALLQYCAQQSNRPCPARRAIDLSQSGQMGGASTYHLGHLPHEAGQGSCGGRQGQDTPAARLGGRRGTGGRPLGPLHPGRTGGGSELEREPRVCEKSLPLCIARRGLWKWNLLSLAACIPAYCSQIEFSLD